MPSKLTKHRAEMKRRRKYALALAAYEEYAASDLLCQTLAKLTPHTPASFIFKSSDAPRAYTLKGREHQLHEPFVYWPTR